MKFRSFLILFSVQGFLVSTGIRMPAQSAVGSVGGMVTDSNRASVLGAAVSIQDQSTKEMRQRTTDASEAFAAAGLPPGACRIRVTAIGFKTFTANPVTAVEGVNNRIDPKLAVGSSSAAVNVATESWGLQTDSAEVRSELTKEQLSNFPVAAGRNYESALILVLGITPPLNSGSFAANPSRGLFFSTKGAFGNSNHVHLDGAPVVNAWLPNVASATAIINTQSGTKAIDGSLFDTTRNNHIGVAKASTPPSD